MKKKIMVVDDDVDILYTVKDDLESFYGDKYEVIRVDSGRGCIELLKNNEIPDLILLDIMMPGMSGWELFDELKENLVWKNIPIIFLTARTDEMAVDAGRFLGEDYIEKPYNREDLKRRIDKALKNASQKRPT
jgi:putative two-component system response regulator